MQRFRKSLRESLQFARTHRMLFWSCLLLGLGPVLAISLLINIHFFSAQFDAASEMMYSVTTQSSSQIDQLYSTSFRLTQNARLHTTLQNDVLPSYGQVNDYPTLNRNFVRLQSLIDAYTLYDNLRKIRFYLPSSLVISNDNSILSMEAVEQEMWYAAYVQQGELHRWYAASSRPGGSRPDMLCTVSPIQDPRDFSRTIGFLRVDLALKTLEELLNSSSVLASLQCFLVDREQGMLWQHGTAVSEAILPMLSDRLEEDACTTVTFEKRKYWLSIHPIGASTMTLLYVTPLSNLTGDTLASSIMQCLLIVLEMIILLVIGLTFAGVFVSNRNNQLKLLNMQINPHFLYNTLDMINWQAINQNLPQIYRPVQSLSRYYKLTLNHGKDTIRIAEEMEHVRLYMDLQNIRFHNGIVYQMEVDQSIQHATILHMVLQPIVENAVIHGIREKASQQGSIRITAVQEDEHLLFTVQDDGMGMDEATRRELLYEDFGKGYGLSNIQQRLRLAYGRKYGLRIVSAPGRGTTVYITMPLTKKECEQG